MLKKTQRHVCLRLSLFIPALFFPTLVSANNFFSPDLLDERYLHNIQETLITADLILAICFVGWILYVLNQPRFGEPKFATSGFSSKVDKEIDEDWD